MPVNKAKKAAQGALYRQRHKDKIAAHKRAVYEANKEQRRVEARAYARNNAEKVAAYQKKYCTENKKAILERRRRWSKRALSTNPQYKLTTTLRSRIRHAMKDKRKPGSAVKGLGCTVGEAKAYIEGKFRPGMTWANHGEWEIDHKVPLSSFNLTDEGQFATACHYTNLQPLWKNENRLKRDRLDIPAFV